MEKLALEIFDRDGGGSKFANLPSDTSITITDTSELFDSGDIWTYSFKLNIYDNLHIFGSAGDMHGSRLHEQVDKRRARLWVLGLPLFYGYIRLDYEVDVETTGDIDISFESGQKTFLDMIEGAKANQVPLKDDVMIGMALDRERTVYRENVEVRVSGQIIEDTTGHWSEPWYGNFAKGIANFAQQFPKYVRPDGVFTKKSTSTDETISGTINKDIPYDSAHPYCNTRICYQKYIWKSNNGTLEKEAQREYKVAEPRRINPSPNFYVLYWIDCLMKHLGIHIEENGMLDVEDLKRLFFVNTKCAYKTKDNVLYKSKFVAEWGYDMPFGYQSPFVPPTSNDEKSWEIEPTYIGQAPPYELSYYLGNVGTEQNTEVTWRKAYATSENFPESSISDVIGAIENGFGVRFLFNNDYTKVRIVLLRDILRSQEVHDLPCDVTEVTKQESSIRGFRLTYGAGEEDTNYFYRGFASKLTGKDELWPDTSDEHDYSQWDMTKHYGEIKNNVRMLNKTCYIDMATGNAYIVKIDENFKNMKDEAYPSLFSCADFMDAEDGDCTGDEETIKEIQIGFSPIIENVISDDYALLVSGEMGVPGEDRYITGEGLAIEPKTHTAGWPDANGTSTTQETIDAKSGLFEIATATHVDILPTESGGTFNLTLRTPQGDVTYSFTLSGYLREGYRLYLCDNYQAGDDLECPLEKVDWGLTLGIMRGSGSDAYIKYRNDPEDNEGNDTWDLQAGSGAFAHSDTCNDSGTEWDYNGEIVVSSATDAQNALNTLFPDSNAPFNDPTSGFINGTDVRAVYDNDGKRHNVLFVWSRNLPPYSVIPYSELMDYIAMLSGHTTAEMLAIDAANRNIIVETDTYGQRDWTLVTLCGLAYSGPENFPPYYIDNGVGSEYGRISLKLRAEKPNPYFDPTQEEGQTNKRYLDITTPALRKRGLMDQFHKEESYWWRNGKTAKQKVQMEVSQYLSIDKTVRQKIGDITGFVKKMQFSVHIQTGMSDVTVEMLYL